MLLDLTRNCYPVPDFCIITSAAFNKKEKLHEIVEQAIRDLEIMTSYTLGSSDNPLVFAMKRLLFAALCFIPLSAIVWVGWLFLSDLTLFPNDIIGTYYEVPVPNKLKVIVINSPDYGYIVNEDDEKIVNRVDSLQVVGDHVFGRDSSVFFSLNTLTRAVTYYESKDQMKESEGVDLGSLNTPIEYYEINRKPYDIGAMIVIVLLSLASSLFFTRKIH